ncbi:MAG: MBL fold metallo-hydrolase [Pyrinomonadaceae bacterium]
MKLIVLGSGTSEPHPTRSSSGYWLETKSGSILLDCSASAVHRMAQEKLDWANLDAIWVSHFHLDHIGGLFPFLFGTKYAFETQARTKSLKIFGAKGLQKLIEKVNQANDYGLLKQPFPLEIIEVEALDKFEILEAVEAVAVKTPHTPESLAVHLRANDKTLVYTGDTGFSMVLGDIARGVDLFICECSFVEKSPVETHLTLSEAMRLARYAKPKKMLLTHLYAEWDKVDLKKEVKKFQPPGEIILAHDGLKLEI